MMLVMLVAHTYEAHGSIPSISALRALLQGLLVTQEWIGRMTTTLTEMIII